MDMTQVEPAYLQARKVLLDALDGLEATGRPSSSSARRRSTSTLGRVISQPLR